MKRPVRRSITGMLVCIAIIACLSWNFNSIAVEDYPQVPQSTSPNIPDIPLPSFAVTETELYPSDVQTVVEDGSRQIVRTYTLTPEQNPAEIPRADFTRDGWRYTLTDITEKRSAGTEVRQHTETVEINTNTDDLNEIIKALAPALAYESEDGYCGTLALDLSSVKCETAGYQNSSYTVSATREYPHLSANDLSLIPKTVTENGRTLTLDGVSWETQDYTTVDYEQIPDSYRAVAEYTATASTSVVTGYITTADYLGEIAKMITGDTVYTAYFTGTVIPKPTPSHATTPKQTTAPAPEPEETPTVSTTPAEKSEPSAQGGIPIVPILIGIAVLAAISGAGAFFFLRRNVKIYRDGFRVLAAKDRISRKKPSIDLSPLEGTCFGIEIDKFTAKVLNGVTLKVIYGTDELEHKLAFEGGVYKIEADFSTKTLRAIY